MQTERKELLHKHNIHSDTEAVKAVLKLLRQRIESQEPHLIGMIDCSIIKMDQIKQQLLNFPFKL